MTATLLTAAAPDVPTGIVITVPVLCALDYVLVCGICPCGGRVLRRRRPRPLALWTTSMPS
jgi:hypothetical protein